jgi:cell division protein FtsL
MTVAVDAVLPARRPDPVRESGPSRGAKLRLVTGTRSRRRSRLLTLAVLVLVAGCLLGLTAFHVALAQSQFRLERLQDRAAEQQARYERLRLHVAELESPARIVAAAQERLGMVPPPGVTYLSPSGPVADEAADRGSGRAGRDQAASVDDWSDVKRNLSSP